MCRRMRGHQLARQGNVVEFVKVLSPSLRLHIRIYLYIELEWAEKKRAVLA